ncbi:MAG: hypothetical protein WC532_02190 [Candidatus Omnitrophota bacterium]
MKINKLDLYAPALITLYLLFQPYFLHGIIDFWETGIYLPFINEVLHGKVAFKDLMLHRGPFEVYAPALLMQIFGKHLSVLTIFFYLGNIAAIIAAVYIGREVISSRIFAYLLIPVLAAKTFPLTFYQNWGGFRFACGLIAVLCAIRFFKEKGALWLFAAALFSACGFFFSAEIGVFSGAAIIAAIFSLKTPMQKKLRWIMFYSAGFMLIFLPVIAYLWINAGLAAYAECMFKAPPGAWNLYHLKLIYPDYPNNIVAAFACIFKPFTPQFIYSLPIVLYAITAVYLFRRHTAKTENAKAPALICLVIYAALMYYGSLRQSNGPQFQMAMQPTLVLFFFFLERYYFFYRRGQTAIRNPALTRVNAAIIFITMFFLLFSSAFTLKFLRDYGNDQKRFVLHLINRGCFAEGDSIRPLTIARGRGILTSSLQADEINSVVAYIQAKTSPLEPVFTFPNMGTFNFLFDRPCFDKFCFSDMAFYYPEWRNGFFARLNRDRPRYIVVKDEPDWLEAALAEYPLGKYRRQVRDFIETNYQRDAVFGRISVYSLNK